MSDPRNQPESELERAIRIAEEKMRILIPHGDGTYTLGGPAFPERRRTIHGPHAEGESNELAEHWRKTALEFARDADMWRLRAWTAIIVAALATLALILHR